MKDTLVPAAIDVKSLPLLALITKTIQVKVRSEAWAWLDQAAKPPLVDVKQ